jgi:hypothetical protein
MAQLRLSRKGFLCLHVISSKILDSMKKEFTAEEARQIGDSIDVNWSEVDLEQFRMGLAVELEHGAQDPETNVTNDDLQMTGKIAWAHLKELPDYYTKLKEVEGE